MIRDLFLGRVYYDGYEDLEDGGPKCASRMTITFRLIIVTFCVFLHILMYSFWTKSFSSKLKSYTIPPSLFEKFLGLLQICVFLLQFLYKFLSHRLIFIISPCHITTLLQGIVLLSSSTNFKTKLFLASMVWSSGAFMALVFPSTGLIQWFGELELFWIQHYTTGLICPLILALNGRFTKNFDMGFVSILYGYHSMSLYHRLLLCPLSMMTWANISYMLCAGDQNPAQLVFGNWYLLAGEGYILFIACVFCGVMYTAAWVKKKIFIEHEKDY
ncbi:hypothetical protein SteCoe_34608 [Stentor coeruleus]|uniref:Transmembrane protein n=1 Tax=Stentor coeruleus TaxID=5963 RepID=A0A1R2AU52_9CILI|nr:hypothetical protein SteCoe_34608 [Stentor coeruleus]